MQRFVFDLSISADEWIRYYRGQARHVVAIARDGRRVRFAAKHLQRHITREGIHGTFQMVIDDKNDLVAFGRAP